MKYKWNYHQYLKLLLYVTDQESSIHELLKVCPPKPISEEKIQNVSSLPQISFTEKFSNFYMCFNRAPLQWHTLPLQDPVANMRDAYASYDVTYYELF